MFERFERPVKILGSGLAVLLAWQLASAILTIDPLSNLKVPELPALASATNAAPKIEKKEIKVVAVMTNNSMNTANGTNVAKGTNSLPSTNELAKSTNTSGAGKIAKSDGGGETKVDHVHDAPPGFPPGMMPPMAFGGLGGAMGGAGQNFELPPDVQARVDKIINSELFAPIMRMPLALLGITENQAFIQATNGQSGPVKVGGEMAGIKLLRIGMNRVLVEQDGEKRELTLFDGVGGESLMPKPAKEPSAKAASTDKAVTNGPSTNKIISSK